MLLTIPANIAYAAALITSFVWAFVRWRRFRFWSFIPLAICLTAEFLNGIITPRLLVAGFERVAPRYATIIQRIEAGDIAVQTEPMRLNLLPAEAELASATWAEKGTNGVLTVTFFVGGSFPVRHWGYLYSSSGEIKPGSRADEIWPKRKKLRDKWFWIAN
ncbi:MAG: hypothetical protein WCO56_12890 [Verrucomicrobiota bacterium]